MDFVPLGNPYPQEVIFKFRVHPGTMTTTSEKGLEGFVCLIWKQDSLFVAGSCYGSSSWKFSTCQ